MARIFLRNGLTRGADNFLARPGKRQANLSLRMARIFLRNGLTRGAFLFAKSELVMGHFPPALFIPFFENFSLFSQYKEKFSKNRITYPLLDLGELVGVSRRAVDLFFTEVAIN